MTCSEPISNEREILLFKTAVCSEWVIHMWCDFSHRQTKQIQKKGEWGWCHLHFTKWLSLSWAGLYLPGQSFWIQERDAPPLGQLATGEALFVKRKYEGSTAMESSIIKAERFFPKRKQRSHSVCRCWTAKECDCNKPNFFLVLAHHHLKLIPETGKSIIMWVLVRRQDQLVHGHRI